MRDGPFHQGQLDGLCGAYAIVNSIKVCIPRLFDQETAAAMMRVSLNALPAKRFPDLLFDGTNYNDLKKMAKAAFDWFNARFFPNCDFEIQSYDVSKIETLNSIDDYWREFDSWIEQDGKALAIVGVEAPYKHWMLIHETNGTRIGVFDSDGKKTIKNRSSFALHRRSKPSQLRLTPGELLRIRGVFHN